MKINYSGISHPGKKRTHNEDSLFFEPPIFAVADGLGGHKAGEIASKEAIREAVFFFKKSIKKNENIEEVLKNSIISANNSVSAMSTQDKLSGMGTTLTIVYFHKDSKKVFYGHVGDSRIYIYHHSKFKKITKDHTYIQYLIDRGKLTKKESASHPLRSALTQAVGTSRDISVETGNIELPPKGSLLLCTDGLYAMVPEDKIVKIINSKESTKQRVNKLLEESLNNGGMDNITIILIDFDREND